MRQLDSQIDSQLAQIGLDVLPMWTPGRGPLHRSLASALREAIRSGQLPSGFRLPAERQLAQRLHISRTTVVAAYELLRQEDLVERRQGSGTRVRGAQRSAPAALQVEPPSRNSLFRRLTDGPDETIDLVGAYLLSPEGLPRLAFDGLDREIARLSKTPGYAPLGHPPLRRAIAEHLSRSGVPTTVEQVLVTGGAQQGIYLAARQLLQPGDPVVVENPTYPGALDAVSTASARLAWVSTGQAGADVEAIAGLAARLNVRLVYVTSTFQNPVGGVMPLAQRRRLAQLVQERDMLLIDDQCLAGLCLVRDEPPPPIAAFAPDAPILTIGSISKMGWGGLRVGWVRAPEAIIARLGRAKAVADLGASLPGQLMAMRLLQSYATLQAERVALLAERFELVSSLLGTLLPSWTWERPQGGLCLWVRLPVGTAADFAQVALRHGVSVVPGPVASPDGSFADYLRLPFGHQPAAVESGMRRLASAWAAYQPTDGARRQTLEVIV
jgi:DNA-binding transcriptional MocR family regulator